MGHVYFTLLALVYLVFIPVSVDPPRVLRQSQFMARFIELKDSVNGVSFYVNVNHIVQVIPFGSERKSFLRLSVEPYSFSTGLYRDEVMDLINSAGGLSPLRFYRLIVASRVLGYERLKRILGV